DDLLAAVPEGAHDAEGGQHFHEWVGDLVGAVILERKGQEPAVDAVEAVDLVRLAPERLDDLRPRERLVEEHVQLGDLLLRPFVDAIEPPADGAYRHADEGDD